MCLRGSLPSRVTQHSAFAQPSLRSGRARADCRITPFDARSEVVRTRESALGNWTADVLLHAYDESLFDKKIVISKNPKFDPKTTVASGADCT